MAFDIKVDVLKDEWIAVSGTTESRTPCEVRIHGRSGRLQQKWHVVKYNTGHVGSESYEWIDVPTYLGEE